jgi:hypothetical protein
MHYAINLCKGNVNKKSPHSKFSNIDKSGQLHAAIANHKEKCPRYQPDKILE